ncbi:hypothetical protein OBBRIDRAFT_740216, partial [Obba rivulosa]
MRSVNSSISEDLDCRCSSLGDQAGVLGEGASVNELRKQADEGWSECARRLRTHNEKVVGAWKEEIDSLLTFSGLFSAVTTAFNVAFIQSLIGLDESPMANGVTQSVVSSVWINTLWLSSLVLSLSGASIGIVVRQWLKHFITPTPYDPKHSAYIHYLRWELGVIQWHVPQILDLLPVCLLLAVILFLVGLVGLLWALNNVVAAIISGQVGLLCLLALYTTMAPAWRPDCPYKSPQAR